MEIKALKEGMSDFKDLLSFFGLRPPGESPAKTTDADPGAVERNVEKHAEALERAKKRNEDDFPDKKKEEEMKTKDEEKKEEKKEVAKDEGGGEKELEKEEAGATKPKESKDAAANDTVDKLVKKMDAFFDRMAARDAAVEEKEKEKEKEKEAKSEDSELIPVPTLAKKEIPENPIPGAPKSVDRRAAIDAMLAIKPALAAAVAADPVRFRDAAVKWNDGYRALTGGKSTKDGDGAYREMTDIAKPDAVLAAEAEGSHRVHDTAADSADYASMMRNFHRQPVGSVKLTKEKVN